MLIASLLPSAYEYFLKYYLYNPRGLQGGDERLKKIYRRSIEAMKVRLIKTSANGLTYLTDSGARGGGGKMEHLACFVPGLLALGAVTLEDGYGKEDMELAEKLAESCYMMYERTETGEGGEERKAEGWVLG